MIRVRRGNERGHSYLGWLDSYHTFSFADYYDPQQMGFRTLRVINEDRVQPGYGFPTHPHRDMEIITYVLQGALEHKDSMGNGSVICPGEVQRLTAGSGITHSEYNHSPDESVHLLQIWILPAERRLSPSYEQQKFSEHDRTGKLLLVASPDGRNGAVQIHQDANLYASLVEPGEKLRHDFASERYGWLQVARGKVQMGKLQLFAGDGAAITGESKVEIQGLEKGELLLFDLN